MGTYAATSSCIALFDPSSAAGAPIAFLDGLRQGGVTQLQFHPTQPHILFAASRRSAFVQRWDLRNTSSPLAEDMVRGSKGTNQRLSFDVDLGGQCLMAGNEVSPRYACFVFSSLKLIRCLVVSAWRGFMF